MASTPNLPAAPRVTPTNIPAAVSTSAYTTVFTAGASGSKLVGIFANNQDVSARDVIIAITRSSVNYQIGRVSVPASSGNAANNPVINLLANTFAGMPIDNDGQPYLLLNFGDTLSVNLPVTLSTGMNIVGIGGDF